MSSISRRAALAAFTAAPAALVAKPARPAEDEWIRLRTFLNHASADDRLSYHLLQAAHAASEIKGGTWTIRHGLDYGVMMIVDYDHLRRRRDEAEAAS